MYLTLHIFSWRHMKLHERKKSTSSSFFVTKAKIHCKCAHTLALLSSECASSRSCELQYEHRSSPYTLQQANCDRTMRNWQWQWTGELILLCHLGSSGALEIGNALPGFTKSNRFSGNWGLLFIRFYRFYMF